MANDNTKRFSNRVEDYVRYRPGYPVKIIAYLQNNFNLSADKLIADIGAGTGISAKLFLDAGYKVVAVEPNAPMREKSVELLGSFTNFVAIDGTAEQTNLEDHCVDAIVVGQAFHWFEKTATKKEFKRILKPNGIVVLIWNERLTDSAFEKEYDQFIISHGKDYVQVDHRNISEAKIKEFFSPSTVEYIIFPNQQVFDLEGLEGRLLSSSYMPAKGEDGYDPMISDLQKLFDKYQQEEKITISYATKVFVSML
jgi:ubiquinone/menaquinone biosynthesis C-methylase UbiE